MRASCEPLAARQPISAAAITQMEMTANIVFCGEACTMKKTRGNDHSNDQATVRHGMNHLDSGRTLASAATRNGVASMANSHAAGIVAVLHNEGFETTSIDGKRVYDMEIERLDPRTVKLQFQVSTMQEGFDPIDYFARYPDRYISMHCQDWVMTPGGKARQVPLGKGVVDWKKVFTAAKNARIENYFVELEQNPALMAQSVPYLKSLQV